MDALTNKTTKNNKGWGKMSSNNKLFSNIWFRGLKTVEEKNIERVDYCGPVKITHKGFFLTTLEK